jgi:hypothetical protein
VSKYLRFRSFPVLSDFDATADVFKGLSLSEDL